MSALVSCIIPVFNGERYVREAIESVQAQRHRPLELIVVDDGSTDGTANLVRSFGGRYATCFSRTRDQPRRATVDLVWRVDTGKLRWLVLKSRWEAHTI